MDTKKRLIIIDMDPGIDDTVALTIVLNHPNLEVHLITMVVGNVDVEETISNALKFVDFFGKRVPVAKGYNCPLLIQLEDSVETHGGTGMGGFEFPQPISTYLDIHTVEAMRGEILFSDTPLTIVPIAASMNIALLLILYPETKGNIVEIIMMGGSLARGNINTSAEFNTYVDPHTTQITS